MEKFTAQAPTTEEAIANALSVLGIDRDEADTIVLQEPKKGFLGIGQRDAIVQVEKKEKEDLMKEVLGYSKDNPPHKQYEEVQQEREEVVVTEKTSSEKKDIKEANKKETHEEKAEVQVAPEEDQEEQKSSEESFETTKTEDTEGNEEERLKEKHDRQDKDAVRKVREYIIDIGVMMGADPLEVEVSYEDNRVHFDVTSEKAGIIIGRHGKVLNAIQSLAQIHLYNAAYSKLHAHVDIEGYRKRREQKVVNIAKKVANKVAQTNQPEVLESLGARERKIVHRYLSKNDKVETHSEGKDPNRYLVVEPVLDQRSPLEENN
jgi:spoIIIJ-associated protein